MKKSPEERSQEQQIKIDNFLKYIKFSENFSETDLDRIKNKIGYNGIGKYLNKASKILKKDPQIKFEIFYSKLITRRSKHFFIKKMQNLAGYIENFCKNEIKNTNKKNEKTDQIKQNKKIEITNTLNQNDIIVEELLKRFCTMDIKEFKLFFTKEYHNTKESLGNDKLNKCINNICQKAIKHTTPSDQIIYEDGEINIITKEDIINKYNELTGYGDEDLREDIFSKTGTNETIQDILKVFFNDHKLDKFPERKKAIKNKSKGDLGALLF